MADPTALTAKPGTDPDTWGKRFSSYGALFVTVCIFTLFFVCLIAPVAGIADFKDTVKALAMVAAGFWLGSSNTSQKQSEAMASDSAAKSAALAVSTPTVIPTTEPSDEAKALAEAHPVA